MVAFRMDGEKAVVCDLANWPSPGNVVRTTTHRRSLEPNHEKWLPSEQFQRRWFEFAKSFFKKDLQPV